MELEYIKVEKQPKKGAQQCPHNEACRCYVKQCHKCGWHPKVAERRMAKIRHQEEAIAHG